MTVCCSEWVSAPPLDVMRRSSSRKLGRLFSACFALGVVGATFVSVRQHPPRQPSDRETSGDVVAPETVIVEPRNRDRTVQADAREPALPGGQVGNLAEMSETYRNTTFLIAIRDAGFVCDAVVAAHQTDADIWMGSCRDVGSSYKIDVGDNNELYVRPVAGYFDGLAPVADDPFRLNLEQPLRLPPQPRRNE
jgi:hypothetical protein